MEFSQLDIAAKNLLAREYHERGVAVVTGVDLPQSFNPPLTDVAFVRASRRCEVFVGSQVAYNGAQRVWQEAMNKPPAPGGARLVTSVQGDLFSGVNAFCKLLACADSEPWPHHGVIPDDGDRPRPRPHTPIRPTRGDGPRLRDLVQEARRMPNCYALRDELVLTIAANLLRESKPGVILVGPSGVGKTTVVWQLAYRIADDRDVPPALRGVSIREFPLGNLVEQVREIGAIEREARRILESAPRGSAVFFVDELHQIGRPELKPLCDILKPALAEGRIRMIGTTTPGEWRNLQDGAFKRRFIEVTVPEPSLAETYLMLSRRTTRLAEHHRLAFPDGVVREGIILADRFLPHKVFPDKAVDILDHAAALQRTSIRSGNPSDGGSDNGRILEPQFMYQALASQSGVPEAVMQRGSCATLVQQAVDNIQECIIGQSPVLSALAQTLKARLAERFVGWEDDCRALRSDRDRRPLAAVLAVGPTGTGKTETAKLLAERLFSGRAIFLSGSDVGPEAPHGLATWVGSPPGYVGSDLGGTLTNGLRTLRNAVIIVDEVEKASSEAVQNCLLPLLGEGAVLDRNTGETLWATQCIVFCTSNAVARQEGLYAVGFGQTEREADMNDGAIRESLTSYFRRELLARFNVILPYAPLDLTTEWAIWMRLRRNLETRMGDGTRIVFDEPACGHIQERLEGSTSGARGVQDLFREAVATVTTGGQSGTTVHITLIEGRFVKAAQQQSSGRWEDP